MPDRPATGATSPPAIPLAGWASRQLKALGRATQSAAISALTGPQLLGERAALNGFRIPGPVSCGGGCHLWPTRDGWIALNLARPGDRDLLPALIQTTALDPQDDADLAHHLAAATTATLLAQGRALGLAIASPDEPAQQPAITSLASGPHRSPPARPPLVVDLSALWAGPLAAHLLWLAGAEVVKLESISRPDAMRDGDPALFARLNQGKASALVDVHSQAGIAALTALLTRADIVIEAARPRALAQLGIDAAALVAKTPGLVWITITAHGATGAEAEHVGFGDDCAVAGGLTAAIARASGHMHFGGDAPADPLTGILAASAAWQAWQAGQARRIGLSMSGTIARALAEDATTTPATLAAWAHASGQPFPAKPARPVTAPLAPLGADTMRYLAC